MRNKYIKCVIYMALILSISVKVFGQKLPNVQQQSILAPLNIKIDGKPLEWGNKFQAYNHATDVYYTIANDDDNLYLAVQSTEPQIIKHIIAGGITLTINKSGKKDDKNSISITYPLFDKTIPVLDFKHDYEAINRTQISDKQMDSLVNSNNNRLGAQSKYIRITGVKGMDTLISVYNDEGIKVAALFDNNMAYTLELAINLKHLALSTTTAEKVYYNVRLNEVAEHGINITKDDAGNITSIDIGKGAQRGQAATDFWGEYIINKKTY